MRNTQYWNSLQKSKWLLSNYVDAGISYDNNISFYKCIIQANIEKNALKLEKLCLGRRKMVLHSIYKMIINVHLKLLFYIK